MTASAAAAGLSVQVRRGLVWSSLSNLVLRAGSFAVGIALARLLAPHQFGAYAVALAVQGVLMTLADLGLSADLIRSDRPEERAPTVGALGLASGSVMALVMAATARPLAGLLGSPGSAPAIAVLSLTLALAGAGVVPYALLQRRFDQRRLFVIAGGDLVVSTALTVTLVLAGLGVMALAIARVAAQSITTILQFVMSGTRPRFRADRRVVGSVVRFGLPIAVANLLSWALMNIDTVVIARVAGTAALGFYVLAFNMSTWPMTAIGQVVRSVALPGFSESRREAVGRDSFGFGAALTWAAAAPAGAALAALAGPVVVTVYGSRWAAAIPVLVGLGVFGAFRVVFDVIAAYLYAHGASGRVLAVQVLWFVLLVPAMVVGTERWGIVGGAWAHVVVAVGIALPAYLLVLRRVGVSLSGLGRGVIVPTAASVLAAIVGYAGTRLVSISALALAVGGLAGAVVYAALLVPWLRRILRSATEQSADGGPELAPAKVSVVIPCFNYAAFLPAAVESALTQDGVDVEVIIVDDASTDGSAVVAEALARRDPRVRLVRRPVNGGPVDTFNDGLAYASGEFLVRLDADDLLTPGSLARSVAVCRRHPRVGLVYGHPAHFDQDPAVPRLEATGCTVWPGQDWLADRCRTGVNVITSPEAFMRMSVVARVGGQRPLAHTHDMEMWMRLASVSDVAYITGADQAWHREHPDSLSTRAEDPLGLIILRERRAAFDVLFAARLPGQQFDPDLGKLARRSLAVEALGRACYEYDRGRAPARSVQPLIDFAVETDPGARDLPEWRALAARARAGRLWLWRRPWRALRPFKRIADDHRKFRRWARTGLYNPLRPAARAGGVMPEPRNASAVEVPVDDVSSGARA